ncbi:MAG TPA: hypothetical protein VMU84_08985 [Thermoanaerobaculia bacterium]|nr:hypothetical protein [Thermoanaerobaculia bacterium]
MPRGLLPGVRPTTNPPRIVCRSGGAILSARRRATLRDAGQLFLLAGVDYLYYGWLDARLPFLDREHSFAIIASLNITMLAWVWLCRAIPRWSAKRVASTWCLSERARFFAAADRLQ